MKARDALLAPENISRTLTAFVLLIAAVLGVAVAAGLRVYRDAELTQASLAGLASFVLIAALLMYARYVITLHEPHIR